MAQAGVVAQLLGHDLDDRAGAAVLSGPGPLLEPTHDHDPAATARWLGGMLGLVPPHDHGDEGRLLLRRPDTATWKMARAIPTVGVADRGVVGEVADEVPELW
jgi:hypothetical protein